MKSKWKIMTLLVLLITGALLVFKVALAGNTAPPTYPALGPAPDVLEQIAQTMPETGDASAGAVHPGTPNALKQITPAYRGGSTFAILGDAAPVNEATAGYLHQTVEELNRLRPDLVLTTGNQLAGSTRSLDEYAGESFWRTGE